MAKLLQRVVSDAASRVSQARRGVPEMQRADTTPEQHTMENLGNGAEYREMLLRHVKKEVKQLMEESVTRKFIHEESSTITSLCGGVENCLLYGLKKRSLGLFKESTTTVLLHKIAKSCPQAQAVIDKVTDYSSQTANGSVGGRRPAHNQKFMWIRVALLEKCLSKIVEYIVEHGKDFYDLDSIIADPCDGPLLASLLVGPCALDFTKVKTLDHLMSDPTADELVQRHRIHSPSVVPSSPRQGRQSSLIEDVIWHRKLCYLLQLEDMSYGLPGGWNREYRRHTSSSSDESIGRSAPQSAREYVELLHQNNRATLLFGKNNVMSQTPQHSNRVPGYLSLHHTGSGLVVKWTPNTLMMGSNQSDSSSLSSQSEDLSPGGIQQYIASSSPLHSPSVMRRSYFRQDSGASSNTHNDWENAITIKVDSMVYIHCHSNSPSGASLVFVAQDGTQQPPFLFPPGVHLLAFLTCLENGLLPNGQLDPPLWSQRGKGKVFPKIKRKSIFRDNFLANLISKDKEATPTNSEPASGQESEGDLEEETMDFVFRIIFRDSRFSFEHVRGDSTDSAFCWQDSYSHRALQERFGDLQHQASLKQFCDSMRKQILARAFYGWLAHIRHIKTVRQHLTGILRLQANLGATTNYPNGLTKDIWEKGDCDEIYRAIYWGGVQKDLRPTVWPYLLGFYTLDMTPEDIEAKNKDEQLKFEDVLSQWGPLEVIVKENDKEFVASARDLLQRKLESAASSEKSRKSGRSSKHHRLRRQNSQSSPVEEETPVIDIQEPQSSEATTGNSSLMSVGTSEAATTGTSTSQSCIQSLDSGLPTLTADGQELVICLTELPSSDSSSRLSTSKESLVSPASPASNGGVYSADLIESIATNWHRIDKDVSRCDRHIPYFCNPDHLDKLRTIMCSYVWEELDVGYIQGFCDLLAPILVVLDHDWLSLACFRKLMANMVHNFPGGAAEPTNVQSTMDQHFANLRALIQVMDPHLYEHMVHRGDYTHFYFCYRWFLLDFKRELFYNDVFLVWETIWAASHLVTNNFNTFVAMAMLEIYRGIIIDNDMDFTDIIKFYNEMAERHNVHDILNCARDLVNNLSTLVDNK